MSIAVSEVVPLNIHTKLSEICDKSVTCCVRGVERHCCTLVLD